MTLQEPGAERDRVIEQAIPPSGCASYKKRATARHFLDSLPEFFGCRSDLPESFGQPSESAVWS